MLTMNTQDSLEPVSTWRTKSETPSETECDKKRPAEKPAHNSNSNNIPNSSYSSFTLPLKGFVLLTYFNAFQCFIFVITSTVDLIFELITMITYKFVNKYPNVQIINKFVNKYLIAQIGQQEK